MSLFRGMRPGEHGSQYSRRMIVNYSCTCRVCFFLWFFPTLLDAQWLWQESNTTERLRAVSAVNDTVAWASGNHGTFVRTTNGGKPWQAAKVPGADSLDFRDIEAFDGQTAFIMSIGFGKNSRIYKTTDGGSSWKMQYIADAPKIFLDEFAFWDSENGIAVGDEVEGRLFLLRTNDGGEHWRRIPSAKMPPALTGEGAFAASGSGITVGGTASVWIGSGGGTARVFRSSNRGDTWSVAMTPLLKENESSGVFSAAFFDSRTGIVVGGDYKDESLAKGNAALTDDSGLTWNLVQNSPPAGFRSAVVYLTKRYLVTVGPSGSDFSTDGGQHWTQIDMVGYHALAKAKDGISVWAVGERGRIGHLVGFIIR